MFVVIIQQRVSAKVAKFDKPEVDWYAIVAVALPFAPIEGTKLQTKSTGVLKLSEVIYNPGDATFSASLKPILHPQPDAKTVAEKLVESGNWDAAVEESTLEEAKATLCGKALRKLQKVITQVQMHSATLGTRRVHPGGPIHI